MNVTRVECVASDVIADDVPAAADEATCPACGARVRLGGTPTVRRYAIHDMGVRLTR